MFREDRATAAAWRFVELHGGSIPHVKLMKLLYFVERRWLIERGTTIFEDSFFAMDEGPVLSEVYNCMKDPSNGTSVGDTWRLVLSQIDNETITRKGELNPSQYLTQAQLKLVDAIWDQYGSMSKDEIVKEAHQLPEWNALQGSSIFIKYISVLEKELDASEAIANTRTALTQQRITGAFGG
jgi:uncharacterized phage-associated protein